MQLSHWLEREKARRGLTRQEFARAIGRSPGLVTQICDGGWVSQDTALAIYRETKGEVTPNDLAGLASVSFSAAPVAAGA